MATATAPTEAEIRAYMEHYPAENWEIASDALDGDPTNATGSAFDAFVESERITDDDYGVFIAALREEIEAIAPAVNAFLRPLLIDAQVRATVRFFERFPDAPRAEPVTA
jgi:hypothetical protein